MKCIFVGNLALRVNVVGKKKEQSWAGSSYFSATTAARLGHEATIVSKVSSKFDPKWQKELDKRGIKLMKQPAWEDSVYEVEYKKDGTKRVSIVSDSGQVNSVPPGEYDIVQIGSYFGKIGIDVLKTLKRPDNLLILDAHGFIKYRNPDRTLTNAPWLEKEEYLKYVDILKINANELYFLTGKTTLNSAMELLKLGPKIVTLTMGTQGAYVFHEKRYIKVPVYEIKKFVDHTGVGDVYATAFAIKFKETQDITDAAYFAAAAASFVVEKKGGVNIAEKTKVEKRYKTLREIFLV
jgi:sugar/nucleoside kinase (ribokinase family)